MKELIYPIGEQDFAEIRKGEKVYIDKTMYIPELLKNKFYFLSRPRRFGKSLFLSTLENFFLGHRELFRELAIESFDWEWEEFPVIRINLGEGSFSKDYGLEQRLYEILEDYESKYGISGVGIDPRARFRNLIIRLSEKFSKKVVILIDEYEKPLLDTIDKEHYTRYQEEIADFYSVLKNNENRIEFLFITGVTRFGHLNIFSGFNNLLDISLDDDFSAICGVTEEELIIYLKDGIELLAKEYNVDFEDALRKVKLYYDGYHFSRKLIDIYNPFSLFICLKSTRLTSKWFQSGSSRYLLENLRRNNYDLSNLEDVKASGNTLEGTDASMRDSVTLLYQSGYLTIKRYDKEMDYYTLGLPNYEVKSALYSAIIPYYLGNRYDSAQDEANAFVRMLKEGEAERAMKWLQAYFGSIPYDVKLNFEVDFQHVVYAFFALVGLMTDTTLEKQTSDGRIDLVLKLQKYVYVFEFKLGLDAQKALDQINSKNYGLQWEIGERKVFKIGVAFSAEKRGIADFIIQSDASIG